MNEVGSSVNGIDDECWGVGEGLAWVVGFFADKLEFGVCSEQAFGDHFLDGLVGFRYEIGSYRHISN